MLAIRSLARAVQQTQRRASLRHVVRAAYSTDAESEDEVAAPVIVENGRIAATPIAQVGCTRSSVVVVNDTGNSPWTLVLHADDGPLGLGAGPPQVLCVPEGNPGQAHAGRVSTLTCVSALD